MIMMIIYLFVSVLRSILPRMQKTKMIILAYYYNNDNYYYKSQHVVINYLELSFKARGHEL